MSGAIVEFQQNIPLVLVGPDEIQIVLGQPKTVQSMTLSHEHGEALAKMLARVYRKPEAD